MKRFFYLSVILLSSMMISCDSERDTDDNEQEEVVCFRCESANSVTICDDDGVTFRVSYDNRVIKIYTYEQVEGAENLGDLEEIINERGCEQDVSIVLGIENGVIIDEVVGGEETPNFTQCVTCAAYESALGGMVNEQEICEFEGNAWVDGVDQGVEYRVILASRGVFTTCQ